MVPFLPMLGPQRKGCPEEEPALPLGPPHNSVPSHFLHTCLPLFLPRMGRRCASWKEDPEPFSQRVEGPNLWKLDNCLLSSGDGCEKTVAQERPETGQGPQEPITLCQAQGPLIAVEEAQVPSSGGNGIDLVVCSLSSNLLKTVTAAELFGGSIRGPVTV